jgi:hypothetical protein
VTGGDDADDFGPETDTVWIGLAPGLSAEVEYETSEYRMADGDGTLPARLTGRVRISREAIRSADWGG